MVGFDTPEMRDDFIDYYAYLYYAYNLTGNKIGATLCAELLNDLDMGYAKILEMNQALRESRGFIIFNSLDEVYEWIKRFIDDSEDDLTE